MQAIMNLQLVNCSLKTGDVCGTNAGNVWRGGTLTLQSKTKLAFARQQKVKPGGHFLLPLAFTSVPWAENTNLKSEPAISEPAPVRKSRMESESRINDALWCGKRTFPAGMRLLTPQNQQSTHR